MREVRKNIHTYVKQGGVRPAPPAEKSKLMVGLDLFTGKSVPSDLKKGGDKDGHAHGTVAAAPVAATASASASTGPARPVSGPPPAPVVAVPVPPSSGSFQAAKSNPFAAGDPFDADDNSGGNPFASAPPMPPAGRPAAPAAPSAPRAANMVEALFDHEAEEEDELNFMTGDLVEVIDKPDGGWWRGRCHGKEGLFPSNYVKS